LSTGALAKVGIPNPRINDKSQTPNSTQIPTSKYVLKFEVLGKLIFVFLKRPATRKREFNNYLGYLLSLS